MSISLHRPPKDHCGLASCLKLSIGIPANFILVSNAEKSPEIDPQWDENEIGENVPEVENGAPEQAMLEPEFLPTIRDNRQYAPHILDVAKMSLGLFSELERPMENPVAPVHISNAQETASDKNDASKLTCELTKANKSGGQQTSKLNTVVSSTREENLRDASSMSLRGGADELQQTDGLEVDSDSDESEVDLQETDRPAFRHEDFMPDTERPDDEIYDIGVFELIAVSQSLTFILNNQASL